MSDPGFPLLFQSLEYRPSGIRLCNVRREGTGQDEQIFATVYVPNSKRGHFLRKISAYANEERQSGEPKNKKLINSIADIRVAVLESFWQDDRALLPGDTTASVEVWLRSDEDSVIAQFDSLLRQLQIERTEGTLKFPERAVQVILAGNSELEQLIEASDDIAEFRLAKEVASIFFRLENQEQLELVTELLGRTSFDDDGDVVICILDTGVNRGHLLLQPLLDEGDLHTVIPAWGVNDHDSHGTLMAGTAAYGDLLRILNRRERVRVQHRLESAKILPPFGQNPKELWGYIMAQGLSRAEIQDPQRKRLSCMAVTAPDDLDRGRPSSWSAKVDELASGYEDDTRRLIVVSAGNVGDSIEWQNYPHANLTNEVHDPGQAWNALTVGAYTEKVQISDPTFDGYTPVAPDGGLSPFSTTSLTWSRKWPIKPEVVFEGGNVARRPDGSVTEVSDLKLLSTSSDPQVAQFEPFCATSASSAQAAWMAAKILVEYPDAWPETVRALIVHAAEWTHTQLSQFMPPDPKKRHYAELLRICGYGVPNFDRALYCASNSLTLISEATLQPFDKRGRDYITRDMHLYDLPWPSDVLSQLGEAQVKMRVTLSYFVEPGPGEVGWENRYRYASHGLRFDVNGPGESVDEFVQRINRQARVDNERPGTSGPGHRWVIGEARNVGSVHSDLWLGRAVELAASNRIAVYPTVGWWRERHHLDRWSKRCRYSLVVSIYTPEQDVDIYTPVTVQVAQPVPVEITVNRHQAQ